ncbi:MAG: ABC transporter substrate-binding protein [Bacteroidetes bacterium]|nr:ABC transporter substrate-binding protein [Bacteroidota bacterium]
MKTKFGFNCFLQWCTLLVLFAGSAISPSCRQHKPVLRVATNLWPGYEMLYLAKNLGYYNEVSVRLVEVPSTSQVTRNLRNHTLEAGCLTLDETLNLLQDNLDLRVILIMDESCGADVLMAKPGIPLKDLKGKRIGIENSTVSAVLLDAALVEAGLQIDEIRQVPMSIDEHFQGYMNDNVDAVATFEPVKSQLLAQGAKVLFSSAQIPGRIIDILVIRTEVIDKYSEELEALLDGYFRALSYFEKYPLEASRLMEKRLGRDPLIQFKGIHIPNLAENYLYLEGDSARLLKSAQNLYQVLLKHKLLRHPFKVVNIAEPEFLPDKQP